MELFGFFLELQKLLMFAIIIVAGIWVFYDASKYDINRYLALIGIVIVPVIGLILYLLITRTRIRNFKLTTNNKILLTTATAIMMLLTLLFPKSHERMPYVYLYGFPDYFFIWYSRDFQITRNSDIPFQFYFNPFQMLINILLIYFIMWLFYKLYSKIFLSK